ncbi:MAG: [Fe-Fe] hydrogenase large subunit C-terminal domain-containing protein [Bacteroidales bacterium]
MDQQTSFHHALFVDTDICNGCVHCMRVCPTKAIRVRDGKARIDANRCIDCGNCYRVCPVRAIRVEQDDLSLILNYPVRVALIPSVFLGQFPDHIKPEDIYSTLIRLGFTSVFEVEHGVEIIRDEIGAYLKKHSHQIPLISSFCPSVVRLIQVRYPSLTSHIIRLKTPHDISAIYCRKYYEDQGYRADQIGIFYVTPCAAKIAAVKSPVGERVTSINGVINMDFLYNKVLASICRKPETDNGIKVLSPGSQAIKWTLTRGEVSCFNVRALGIDGIQEVCNFLEKVEMDQVKGVDFLELRACQEGCPGGILAPSNPFLTVETMEQRAVNCSSKPAESPGVLDQYRDYLISQASVDPIEPRSILKLDQEVGVAMTKLTALQDIESKLPGLDCAACGAPECNALAEDIILGKGSIEQCPFIGLGNLIDESADLSDVIKPIREVWSGKIKQIKL